MKRRAALATLLTLVASALPGGAHAAASRARVGLLWIESERESNNLAAFRTGLRAHGYVEGRDVELLDDTLVDRYDRLPDAAARLVAAHVDVIVSYGTTATLAAAKATSAIPIVMITGGDPVQLGLVASLSRPGGNVTGVTFLAQELVGKRLELLKETIPGARRVGVVFNPASATESANLVVWESPAKRLDLQLQRVEIRLASDIEGVIGRLPRDSVDALAVVTSTMFVANRKQLVAAIARVRVPAVYGSADNVEAGGLISYGPDWPDGFRRAAGYVAKLLKGARPGDLPFEQPTKFELAVNVGAAQALGITIPSSVLLRADKVVG